jgi:hypothetical protein
MKRKTEYSVTLLLSASIQCLTARRPPLDDHDDHDENITPNVLICCIYIHIYNIYMNIQVPSDIISVFEYLSLDRPELGLFNLKQPHPAQPAGTAPSPPLPLCAAHQLYSQPSDCHIVLRLAVTHVRDTSPFYKLLALDGAFKKGLLGNNYYVTINSII